MATSCSCSETQARPVTSSVWSVPGCVPATLGVSFSLRANHISVERFTKVGRTSAFGW